MKRLIIFVLLCGVPVTLMAQEKDAKTVAQDVLDKGSAFLILETRLRWPRLTPKTRSSVDRQRQFHERDQGQRQEGPREIESLYRDLFKDAAEKTTSKNTVEFARFVVPDLMVIQGVFQPNIDKPAKFPFVQMRVKQGDKWLMKNLQFYVFEQN